MKILYYGQILSRIKITGVERFAINQIKYLSKESGCEFIIISKDKINLSLPANCRLIRIPFLNHFTFLLLGKLIKMIYKCDYLISPHSFPILMSNKKDIFTIHDIAWFYYPKLFPKLKRYILGALHFLLIKSDATLHCVSESTMNDVKKFYGRNNDIFVAYPGVEYENKPSNIDSKIIEELNSNLEFNKYILFIGTYQKRKNLQYIFKCIDESELEIYLKIIGGPGWFSEDVINEYNLMKKKSQVEFLGYVSESEKDIFIKNCICMVLPSMYEGFGFPIIESLKYNKITIAADNSSMSEIVKDSNLLFNLDSTESFIKALNFAKDPVNADYLKEYIKRKKMQFTCQNFSKTFISYLKINENNNL